MYVAGARAGVYEVGRIRFVFEGRIDYANVMVKRN